MEVRAKRAELVCAVESEKRANGGTSATWGLVYLVCLVCLVVRIGCPTRRTRETKIVFPQPIRFEAQQERGRENISSLLYCLQGQVDWRGLSVRPDR